MEQWARMGFNLLKILIFENVSVFRVTSNDGERNVINNYETLRTTLRKILCE